jgi:UDP-glucose 4-epimerase
MGEMTEESGQTRVLVTGATGAIGPRIVHALHQAGCLVGTFSLDAPAPGVFPDDVEVLRGDIADLPAVQAAVQGVEIIIHLAGLLHILNPTAGMRKKYESINVGGTAAVIEASLKAGVRRVVLFSTIAVYGYAHLDGGILNEDSSPRPDTVYGETKLAAERLLLNVRRHDGRPLGVVLRLGAVYGSRIKGNYQRLVHALAKRRFIPIGSGNNRRTLVYDKDVARAVVLAMRHPAAGGRIYNVTDGRFHTVAEIITAICTALGRTPPRFSIPVGPARLAAELLEYAARLAGRRSPVGRATIEKYIEDVAVDGRRIQAELGFRPEYDLQSAWRETVGEMRDSGELWSR